MSILNTSNLMGTDCRWADEIIRRFRLPERIFSRLVPPGTVLFSDDFENDPTGSNWKVLFQSYTNGSTDYNVVFGYDYTSGSLGNLPPIPAAPHSTNGDTKGLYMTVNQSAGVSAGVNVYLKNHIFSGNYALRFDLFLVENSTALPTSQSQIEDVLFGINHDGNHNNWFRNSATGTSPLGSPTESDGLFFDVGTDGNGGGGAPYDFAAWSGPTCSRRRWAARRAWSTCRSWGRR